MYEGMSADFSAMGIPFFGVNPSLVVDKEEASIDSVSTDKNVYGKVTKDQLLELQRRMVRHLEDLYGD